MPPLRIAIVGFGKIARDQHLPSIAADPRFELAATVSPRGGGEPGVPCFTTHQEMLAQVADLDAVAVTTPPSVRYGIARDCIEAGLHVLLEKPPGVTLGEVEDLARLAAERQITLFTSWHAQYGPAVAGAAERLAGRPIESLRIVWHEDVRKWHPGQQWIWEPGGFGVFDAGINALSIASRIFPGPLLVRGAQLLVPANRQAPIAAKVELASPGVAGPLSCDLDWRHCGEEAWTIEVGAANGKVLLTGGGSRLFVGGEEIPAQGPSEYPALYDHFATLVESGRSHVDTAPLRIAADAFLLGRRIAVEPFEDALSPGEH